MIDKHAPRARNLVRMGSKADCVERILTTYVETGRSVRSLASLYGVGKSTIHRYVKDYARNEAPRWLFQQGREVARQNRLGGASDSDEYGSLD